MKSWINEFKEFVQRGNVVDMAVGIVVGAAFGTVVKSFVQNVLMPPIGLLLGGTDFSNLFILLKEGTKPGPYPSLKAAVDAGATVLAYGQWVNDVVNFLIISFAIFLVIKGMNALNRKKEETPAAPPEPPEEIRLLREIRDALKGK
jgi:large conductance mechanosensitive channel